VPVNDTALTTTWADYERTATTSFNSVGRNQPYAAHTSQQVAQNPISSTVGQPPYYQQQNQPKNTFYRHNGPGGSVGAERHPSNVGERRLTDPEETPPTGSPTSTPLVQPRGTCSTVSGTVRTS